MHIWIRFGGIFLKMYVRYHCKINLKIDFSLKLDLNKIMKTLCHSCLVSFRYCRTIWKKSAQRIQCAFIKHICWTKGNGKLMSAHEGAPNSPEYMIRLCSSYHCCFLLRMLIRLWQRSVKTLNGNRKSVYFQGNWFIFVFFFCFVATWGRHIQFVNMKLTYHNV